MIFGLLLTLSLILKCLSKKFVLLPYNSVICQNDFENIYKYHEFTIIQQINLHTNADDFDLIKSLKHSENVSKPQIDSDNYQYYLCRTLFKPMGRPLDFHNEYGEYSFWNIRIKIDRVPGLHNCKDYLLLQYRHKENHITILDGHSAKVINITCKTELPIVVPSELRKLYITYFSNDNYSPGYTINITSFIYFKGNFQYQFQQDLCRRQDGFWCVNETACIFRDMNCDGYDSCFDGGSDETDCTGAGQMGNLTIVSPIDRRSKGSSGFIDYLPWFALGILPLILLLALVCICNQHRSEVYFDEEEDNLEVEKYPDEGDDRWSSVDGLEKINDDTMEEACDSQCCEANDSMGLVPLTQSTKVDIASHNDLSGPLDPPIIDDYVIDGDKAGILPLVSNSCRVDSSRDNIANTDVIVEDVHMAPDSKILASNHTNGIITTSSTA